MASSTQYAAIPADETDDTLLHPDSSDLPRDSIDDPNSEEPGQNDPLLSRSVRYHDDEDSPESPTEQAGLVPRFLSWSRKARHTTPSTSRGRHSGRRCWWWPSLKTKEERRTWLIRFSFGAMVITIIALVITVAILGIIARRTAGRSHFCVPHYPRATSHLPHANSSLYYARSYHLNFPATYPPLKTSSPECKAAWDRLDSVNCHEKIWNRSWDNGTQLLLFEPQINDYTEALCTSSCPETITKAHDAISAACSTDNDVFDLAAYVGPFLADTELEAGPVAALGTIRRRLKHMCRVDSSRIYWDRVYCPAVLYSDWFIVDGMNADVLTGLDMFEHMTSTNRTDLRYESQIGSANMCDDVYGPRYRRDGRSGNIRKHGPGVGETTCGECVLDWFERKMMSWSKDRTVDPETGKPMALPDLLHRVSRLGRRCETDQWDRVYDRAVARYKNYGLLPPDWKAEGLTSV